MGRRRQSRRKGQVGYGARRVRERQRRLKNNHGFRGAARVRSFRILSLQTRTVSPQRTFRSCGALAKSGDSDGSSPRNRAAIVDAGYSTMTRCRHRSALSGSSMLAAYHACGANMDCAFCRAAELKSAAASSVDRNESRATSPARNAEAPVGSSLPSSSRMSNRCSDTCRPNVVLQAEESTRVKTESAVCRDTARRISR